MVRSGRGGPRKIEPKVPVIVQNESVTKSALERSAEVGDNTKPIRTILSVEVGDMSSGEARGVVNHIMNNLPNGHPHYVVLSRHGKITGNVEFEAEFLNTVKELCEVKDGEIVIKGGAVDVDIIRRSV